MSKKIVIVDCGLGNLYSVSQGFKAVGVEAQITSNPSDIENADGIIFPGVGSFPEAMKNLAELNLIEPLKNKVNSGTPLFGICLGMQLLFVDSEEFKDTKGLGFINGKVKKFEKSTDHRVPHIGWSTIHQAEAWQKSSISALPDSTYMYFVHSYYVDLDEKQYTAASSNFYDMKYCSAVQKDNIFATQFHPEKSGENGLKIYAEWLKINNLI